MNLDEILNRVSAFDEFLTVEELNESSRELENEFLSVKLFDIGQLFCSSISRGATDLLCPRETTGLPHSRGTTDLPYC